jgi:DNA-binding NarL/FixJ family response regulator
MRSGVVDIGARPLYIRCSTQSVDGSQVILADDHQIVREGLRALLERHPELSVIGETADGLRVADLVERLKPDVLVVDLVMPGLGGPGRHA